MYNRLFAGLVPAAVLCLSATVARAQNVCMVPVSQTASIKVGCSTAATASLASAVDSASDPIQWYALQAERGFTDAQVALGWMLYNGYPVDGRIVTDHQGALKWWTAAAERGSVDATYALGFFWSGTADEHRPELAAKYLGEAADRGHARAQYALGKMLESGDGVPQNLDRAASLIERAAQQRLASAQLEMSLMYAAGRGVRQDNATAYMWRSLADVRGAAILDLETVDTLLALESRITVAERVTAARMAADWQSKHMSAK